MICNTHKLPFAQTWIITTDAINMEFLLSMSKKGSYMCTKKVTSFQRDYINFYLRKGQGVAWKAFLSSSSCFCKNITQIRICDYGLVFSARRADLTGCFAICLKSTCTGEFVYIVELFLPPDETIYTKPWVFLSSLLATMKKKLKTFTLRSGQEIGDDLPVEVIRIFEDELHDSFMIKKPITEIEGPKKPGNMTVPMACERATVEEVDAKHNKRSYFCTQQNTVPHFQKNFTLKTMISSGEVGGAKLLEEQQRKMPKIALDIPCVSRSTSKKSIHGPSIHSRTPCERTKTENSVLENVAKPKQEESFMTIKADCKGDVIKFQLCPSSGITNLRDEVMKRLKLSTGTFKIQYQNADENRVQLNTDGELHQYMNTMRSLEISTMKLFIESVVPQNESVENKITLTVKAKYKDDIVKFDLPPLGIVGLKNEIMKRFKLEAGSFDVKHEKILLDNDAILHSCIGSMNLSHNTVMRLSIEPIRAHKMTDRECLLTVKASYKDDIIKFQLSVSSGMVELKNELMKRLKLDDGSFIIKCRDKDHNEIVLDKDALLSSHMKSMGVNTMKIFLFDLTGDVYIGR
ncbi:protein NLP6-like isoform X2 [Henckelia pumila]